jgi:hypothetical protein
MLHAGSKKASGASVTWIGELLGRSAEEISALAVKSILVRSAPIFPPPQQSRRSPLSTQSIRIADGSNGDTVFDTLSCSSCQSSDSAEISRTKIRAATTS